MKKHSEDRAECKNAAARFLSGTLAILLLATLGWAQAGQAPAKREPSVKPGINEHWKTDNIVPLVEQLEAESREIFRYREQLAALVAPKSGAAVADVGAGSGFMTELFAQIVGPQGKVYAVDINAKLLERIADRARQAGRTNVATVVAHEDHANLPPNSVDLVFLCDTYHHFEYPRATMQSIYDALRPGGEIVLVEFRREPDKSQPRPVEQWILDHVRAGQEEFTREIVGFGFALVGQLDAPFLSENYVLRFRKKEKPMSQRLPAPVMAQGRIAIRPSL